MMGVILTMAWRVMWVAVTLALMGLPPLGALVVIPLMFSFESQ